MSLTAIAALALQVASVVLLRIGVGRGWLARPFTFFVFAACVYHGISEILISHTPARELSASRWAVGQQYIDDAMLAISAALLASVCGYLLFARRTVPAPPSAGVTRQLVDWRITGVVSLPLIVVTARGDGYNPGRSVSFATDSLATNFAEGFLILLVVLTAFGFVARYGARWFAPALIVQSAVLATAGQRLELFIGATMLTVLLRRVGLRPSRRAIVVTLGVAVLAALGITSVRAADGRGFFYEDSGLVARAEVIAAGALSPPDVPALVSEAADRIDGNTFAGQADQSLATGSSPLGASEVVGSLVVVVPSALYPDKLSDPRSLGLKYWEVTTLNLVPIDYVPGSIGLYLGAVGPLRLPILMFFVGILLALLENFVLRTVTVMRFLLLAALLQGVLFYEKDLLTIAITLRDGALLILGLYLLRWVGKVGIRGYRGSHASYNAQRVVREARRSSRLPSMTSRWSGL